MSDAGQRLFRDACARFATGVTAVTGATPAGELAAITVNSFASVSLDPARVLVCIAHRSSAFPVLSASSRIAVHVLTDEQEEVARRLATAGLSAAERLTDVPWRPGAAGEPLLAGVAARLAGPVVQRVDSGDHVIVVLDVDDLELGPLGEAALVFVGGRFRTVSH